jgi:TRAP-type transport system small permease protein
VRRALRTFCGLLAAVALFAIMMLTLVDVSGRKVLSTSVPGSLELTELLMVVVIFTSLPLVALAGEHVVFDSFDAWLPRWFKRAQQATIELLCAAALAALAWLMWTKGSQMTEYGDVTAQLRLPLGIFVHLMSLLIGLAAFAHLLLVLQPVSHHHIGVDGGVSGSVDGGPAGPTAGEPRA